MKPKNKKAQYIIDPRWIILIALIATFIVYLRIKGFF